MKQLLVFSLFFLCLHARAANDAQQKLFEGEISDSQCGFNVHSVSRSHDEMLKTGYMGKTGADCALNCVRGRGGTYVFVLSDKTNAYQIAPQDIVKPFVGQKVSIQGVLLDGKINIKSIRQL